MAFRFSYLSAGWGIEDCIEREMTAPVWEPSKAFEISADIRGEWHSRLWILWDRWDGLAKEQVHSAMSFGVTDWHHRT